MPPNAARNWGKNTNFIWERKFCGILTAKNISGGRSTGTGSRQPGDALEFVSSRPVVSELYLHSARVFTQPGPSSVLSSCFPLITPGPPRRITCVFFVCLFVFVAQPCPPPSHHPTHKAPPALSKKFMPTWSKRLPKRAHTVYRPSEPRRLKGRQRFKEGGERTADKELFVGDNLRGGGGGRLHVAKHPDAECLRKHFTSFFLSVFCSVLVAAQLSCEFPQTFSLRC